MKYRLGIDVGTNSLGWAALKLDENGAPSEILKSGVRIFTDGRDPKSLSSLKATRREKRQARRGRDRYLQRRRYLISELITHRLMPEDEIQRKALVLLDPYEIRTKALDQEVDPYEIGRALFHLNQRRGFKSNRKTADGESGVVKQSVEKLQSELQATGSRTIGEFLAKKHTDSLPVRARRQGSKKTDLYDFYPNRQMLEDEFDAIWSAQSKFNASIFTTAAYEKIKEVIFYQRPLKPQIPGKCTLLPDEFRAPKALPSFQNFRIFQELNNLEWIDQFGRGNSVVKHPHVRNQIASALERSQKRTFKQIGAILKKAGLAPSEADFNLKSVLRDHLDGNLTSYKLANKKFFGERWHSLSLEEQDSIVELLLDDTKDDEVVLDRLRKDWGLTEEQSEQVLNVSLPDGFSSLSKAAIDRILPIMEDQGLLYFDAVVEAGFPSHSVFGWSGDLLDNLPYYGEVVAGHVMPGSGELTDSPEKRYGAIANPTVHIAMNQVRRVLNDLFRVFGKPEEISIEVGRDLPLGVEGKRNLEKRQKENQDKNDAARKTLSELKQLDSRQNRQRVQLWTELNSDPTQRRCPFSGKQISLSSLFTDNVEIEHLLPFSQTLDDSLSNKTLALRQANRDKGNQTPYEAFNNSPSGYNWEDILERSLALPANKRWRFRPDAMQRFLRDNDFLSRQLNDTRYISRLCQEYLASVVPSNKIWVVTGHLTALLRGFWGLNSILRGHNLEEASEPTRKFRDDHRHHRRLGACYREP